MPYNSSERTGTDAGLASESHAVQSILRAREARWIRKTALARQYGTSVLSLCLNIPGPEKNPAGVRELLAELGAALEAALRFEGCEDKVVYEQHLEGADGPCRLLVVSVPPMRLKKLALQVEEKHPLGRLADVDVLSASGEPVSRRDIGLAPRRCFLCDGEAALCRARGAHSMRELEDHVKAVLAAVRHAGIRP